MPRAVGASDTSKAATPTKPPGQMSVRDFMTANGAASTKRKAVDAAPQQPAKKKKSGSKKTKKDKKKRIRKNEKMGETIWMGVL